MADTTGRIPLWLIGTVAGIALIGLASLPLPAPFTITSARCKPTVRIASTAVL